MSWQSSHWTALRTRSWKSAARKRTRRRHRLRDRNMSSRRSELPRCNYALNAANGVVVSNAKECSVYIELFLLILTSGDRKLIDTAGQHNHEVCAQLIELHIHFVQANLLLFILLLAPYEFQKVSFRLFWFHFTFGSWFVKPSVCQSSLIACAFGNQLLFNPCVPWAGISHLLGFWSRLLTVLHFLRELLVCKL